MTPLADYQQMAYLALADEMDPMGADPLHPTTRDDLDPDYILAADQFARERGIPKFDEVGGMDNALRAVEETNR